MKLISIFLALLTIIAIQKGAAQEPDVMDVLDSARLQLVDVKSYSVDALFEVDFDFVNMPAKTAHITYQAPDKIDVETDGFLLLPKFGMKPLMKKLDFDAYHAFYLGQEEIDGKNCHVIKMIPKKNNRVVLSTLWIDVEDYLVIRWETFTKRSGSMLIDMKYDEHPLPSQMIFSFEVSGMNIPLKYFGNEVEIDKAELKNSEVQSGNVTVYFSNYQISMQ